ncbi:hypothetical protein Ahu01nite_006540 [Winogradskya humida]|uniref:Uncharacterized protein n=2 Tax=Winogradskya humida TaxID=113566 RepID=A0ABQ3ZG57_9ACTN|nr:hypothetical protein Ahu01nite_006540 [Actinoplanes humidus]
MVLSAAGIGSVLFVLVQRFFRYGTCYDVQTPEEEITCDAYSATIATGERIVVLIALASAAVMALLGVADGARRRVVAPGSSSWPVLLLMGGSPAGLLGYLTGWLAGWAGRGRSRQPITATGERHG